MSFEQELTRCMNHDYWTKILAIPEGKRNVPLERIATGPIENKQKFLTAIANGFYPISCSSPIAAKRITTLSKNEETVRIARDIYEIEEGLHPLVPTTPNHGMAHSEQFRKMLESLEEWISIKPRKYASSALYHLRLDKSSLVQALATAYVIENIAPHAIRRFRDFMSQWQTYSGRRTELTFPWFLNEHEITEGGGEEQHIGLIDKMLKPYQQQVHSPGFTTAIKKYHEAVLDHLDRIHGEIVKLGWK